MRDYGKVSPQFWIGDTGRALRGNPEAQLVAIYLMTSPHANMIGVFHCPITYIAHETGIPFEGASKGLQSLIEADFCTYDSASEYVCVHEFAKHQVGEALDPKDNRVKAVERELEKLPKGVCWQAFRARYAVPYNLAPLVASASPSEAPQKALRSQKQKQKQKQEQEQKEEGAPAAAGAKPLGVAELVAEGVDASHAADWLKVRKQHRAPLTLTAWAGTKREAAKAGITPAEAVRISAERSWRGFVAEWVNKGAKTTVGRHSGFENIDYREGVNADGSFV